MRRIVAKPNDTFPKIAYRYFQNSSKYKDILDVNPGYTSVDIPVPGDFINLPNNSEDFPSKGALNGGSLVTEIRTSSKDTSSFYYPWNSESEVFERCLDYAPEILEYPRRPNGYTLDSYEAENGKEISTSVFLTQQLIKGV